MGHTRLRRPVLLIALAASVVGPTSVVAPSHATVTIGSALTSPPSLASRCNAPGSSRGCLGTNEVLPGRDVAAPSTGTIVSWHALLGATTEEQLIRLRIVRRVGTDQLTVISSGPLHHVPAGAGSYEFPDQLAIASGDRIALESGFGTRIEWRAPLAGATNFTYALSPLNGGTTDSVPSIQENDELTFNAVLDPANAFTLGKSSLNKKKGTATVKVDVPNPGELTGSGKGAKVSSAAAVTSKAVSPGQAKLKVKAKGKSLQKLNDTGTAKLKLTVTYTPSGGTPSTQKLKVTLKKNL
jgi:hypothetical protein